MPIQKTIRGVLIKKGFLKEYENGEAGYFAQLLQAPDKDGHENIVDCWLPAAVGSGLKEETVTGYDEKKARDWVVNVSSWEGRTKYRVVSQK